jgi:hypothetical protein
LNLPWPLKLLIINVMGVIYRLKFYSAWYLAQTAVNLSGLSWNESNKKYDTVIAGDIRY